MSMTCRLFSWETKRKMLICSGRNGQQRVLCVSVLGGGMYVHSLNFKATFRVLRRRPRHCQYVTIVCNCPNCFHSLNLSSCWLSPFHLFYVTVSRPCCLSEFYTNRASRKVWYSGYQDFKLPCTMYIQLLDSGGSRGGACSPPPLFIFRPRLKKNFFGDWAPSYLRTWMAGPPLIWRSGSATA